MTVVSRAARLAHRMRSTLVQPYHRWRGRRIAHFLHIGKTGGTAIKAVLGAHSVTDRYAVVLHNHAVALWDVPTGDAAFFVLRNPISRFVSGFYSRQRQGLPAYYSPWTPAEAAAFSAFSTANELALALTAPSESERRRAEDAMKAIRHIRNPYGQWLGSEQYLMSRAEDIIFVGQQESLTIDFERLKATLGLPGTARLPADDGRAHRNPPHLDRSLEPAAVSNLRRWYARDFALLDLIVSLSIGGSTRS